LKIEFLNVNNDPKLNPEIKPLKLSRDSKNKPPSYCLPWVEAARYSIQLKSNANYVIKKTKDGIEGWIEHGKRKVAAENIFASVPEGVSFVPFHGEEYLGKKITVSQTPGFSSPWQRKMSHSLTLKLGICWWSPPGWGLFLTSAIHRNEEYRIVEGMVRTDLWHRDIPVIVRPLKKEIRIPKFSPVASLLVIPVEDIKLIPVVDDQKKTTELINQISKKRLNPSIYKALVRSKKKKS